MRKKFIYDSGIDAFSYVIVFIVSVIVPTIISIAVDEAMAVLLTMLINAVGIVRDYGLLLKYEKAYSKFWFKRLLGLLISCVIILYSVIALCCLFNDIGSDTIRSLNIVASILFFEPCVIAVYEGILYLKMDYNKNVVVETKHAIAQGDTVAV